MAKPVLPTIIGHRWNEDGSLTPTSEIFPKKVEELSTTKSFIAMIILLRVGRATMRKIFDLIFCYLVLKCIV